MVVQLVRPLFVLHYDQLPTSSSMSIGRGACVSYSSTREVEAGGLGVQEHPQQSSKLGDSMGSCSKVAADSQDTRTSISCSASLEGLMGCNDALVGSCASGY